MLEGQKLDSQCVVCVDDGKCGEGGQVSIHVSDESGTVRLGSDTNQTKESDDVQRITLSDTYRTCAVADCSRRMRAG